MYYATNGMFGFGADKETSKREIYAGHVGHEEYAGVTQTRVSRVILMYR